MKDGSYQDVSNDVLLDFFKSFVIAYSPGASESKVRAVKVETATKLLVYLHVDKFAKVPELQPLVTELTKMFLSFF
jgi:hypothetical protein